MQKYKSNITTTSGAAIRGVPVLVLDETGIPASLFLDRAGTVAAPNPLATGHDGVFYFYAANGRYSLRTTVEGVTITDHDVVLLMDVEEITFAGPIADAVRRAESAAQQAQAAVEDSGIPDLLASAQNAVADAQSALSAASVLAQDAQDARDAAAFAGRASSEAQAAAQAAVIASASSIKAYATRADAAIAAALLPDGADVEVSQDETRAGARTRYKVQMGELVFAANLDQTRLDIENKADASKGAALVGYDDGTAQSALDEAKPMQGYAALRAYKGRASGVRITSAGIAGFFQRSATDATSPDNGGTVIVDASGRRWKRLHAGFANVRWFGAKGDGMADDGAAINAAIAAVKNAMGGVLLFPTGAYKHSATLAIPEDWPIVLAGEGIDATILKYTGGSNAINLRRTGVGSVVKSGIERMRITGNAAAVVGVDMYFAYACFLRNVLIDNFRTGLSVEQTWSAHFDMVSATTCTEDGVVLGDESNNLKFTACEFFNNGRSGAYLLGPRAVTFDACTFETNLYGAYVSANAAATSHGILFTGCYIEGNTSAEMRITREAGAAPAGISITSCYFVCLSGKAATAIRAEFADGLFVDNNFFSVGTATYAYSLFMADGATLKNAHFGANEDQSANGPYRGAGVSYRNQRELEPVAKGRFTVAGAAIGAVKSFGVAGVVRVGVGIYEVTLRQPMAGTDYTVLTDAENGSAYVAMLSSAQPPASTTVFRIHTAAPGGADAEARTVNFTVWK